METSATIGVLFLTAAISLMAGEPPALSEARSQYLEKLRQMQEAFTAAGENENAQKVQAEIDATSPRSGAPGSGLAGTLANTTWLTA